jgi:hypothetical protein
MAREEFIANIILQMREYQRLNGITKKCVDNSQYLYDIINSNGGEVVVKPYIVLTQKNDESYIFKGHLAINFIDDYDVIEPSYEVWSLDKPAYFDNVKDFVRLVSFPSEEIKKEVVKDTIHSFVKFVDLAKKINSGEFVITDKSYYHSQDKFIKNYLQNSEFKNDFEC